MNTIEEIDWNEMWKSAIGGSNWKQKAGTPEFWDERVDWFEELVRQSDRAGMIMDRIKIEPDYTVLDIGAGPGTVAIPLAGAVEGVTVVEPSSGMRARLKENASKHNLTNITCIPKKWEDVEIGKDIESGGYDVVIASHSLVMKDMRVALSKMNDAVKRSIYMFIVAGRRRETDKNSLWELFNKEQSGRRPDYIYLYNILYQMGIYANVEIIDVDHNTQFPDLDSAVRHYKEWMGISGDDEGTLRSYLGENLIRDGGALWLRHNMRTAMIWIRKEDDLQ